MTAAFALTVTMTVISVPPGEETVDHTQPDHSGQPVVRYFLRRGVDDLRRDSWSRYTDQLDEHWKAYVRAGRSPEAWEELKRRIRDSKQQYVYQDPYLVPAEPRPRYDYRSRYPYPLGKRGNVQLSPHHHAD